MSYRSHADLGGEEGHGRGVAEPEGELFHAPVERPAAAPPGFAVGERVRTRASRFDHHTRLPGYARGKIGRVEHVRGVHVFADTHAHGRGEQPQWLYTVVFSGRELWGDDCAPGLGVSIDAWEPYLEMAP